MESENELSSAGAFILVDCNDLSKICSKVTPKNIVEVIDHHEISEDAKNFINANLDIQKVGAMATLVVEKFIDENIKPSLQAATLLYHAIASNTINLKGGVTTQRDLKAFNFLEKLYSQDLSPQNITDIFVQKSKIDDVQKAVLSDLKIISPQNHTTVIGQLELVNARDFCCKNDAELRKIVRLISEQYKTENVMINMIDILNGFNIMLCTSQGFLKNNLTDVFGLDFKNGIANTDKIIMRKQIVSGLSQSKIEHNKRN